MHFGMRLHFSLARASCLLLALPLPAGAALAEDGSATRVAGAWTNFLGVSVAGPAESTPRMGGRLDAWITVDGRDMGPWDGFAVHVRPEFIYGESVNRQGSGETLPINTALSFPEVNTESWDLALTVSQEIGKARLTLGKINTVDLKTRTPILGGGGIDGFQFLQFAAPITLFTPPMILGGLLNVPVGRAAVTLGLWDPVSAIRRTGFEERPFREGVAGMAAVTLPVRVRGQQGWQSFTVSGNSRRGIDLDDIPDLTLPPEAGGVIGTRQGGWLVKYAFQQYLWQDPTNPKRGWGLFGDFSVWDSNPTPFEWGMSFGATGEPGFAHRPDDRIGLGYFRFSLASDLVEGLAPLVPLRSEQGVELFYTAQLRSQIALTANVQWLSPAQASFEPSLFTGLRLTARF